MVVRAFITYEYGLEDDSKRSSHVSFYAQTEQFYI